MFTCRSGTSIASIPSSKSRLIGHTTHHVHLCASGSEQEAKHLAFRNHLRAHPETARQYLEFKQSLAAQHHGATQESRESYSLAKSSFVEAVLQKAMRVEVARSGT